MDLYYWMVLHDCELAFGSIPHRISKAFSCLLKGGGYTFEGNVHRED